MANFLKTLLISLCALILIAGIGITLLVTFVSPNHLKPIISEQILKHTGREITIDGDLSWTLYPYLGVHIGHAKLSNPPNFAGKAFAEIQQATVGVKIRPLFHGQIESNGITLSGMQLNLRKNARGEVNWIMPTTSSKQSEPAPAAHNQSTHEAVWALAIANINVEHANINMRDEQNNKDYKIENFSFQANNIAFAHDIPFTSSFDFAATNPAVSGHVNLSAKANIDRSTAVYKIMDINLSALMKQNGQSTPLNMHGNLTLSSNKVGMAARGIFTIPTLQIDKIKMHTVSVNLQFKNGFLTLDPITANLYEGSLNSQTQIQLNAPIPKIVINGKLTHIQIKPLLQDMSGADRKLQLSGTSDLSFQVTTSGNAANTLINNLNGQAQVAITQGTLEGVDLGYLVDSSYAVIKGKSMSSSNEGKTSFGTLTASAIIRNGDLINNDLLLDSPRFIYNGKGHINLVTQRINYELSISMKQGADQPHIAKELNGIAVPIEISGDLKDPSVRLDSGALAKIAAQQQIQKTARQLQEKFKDKIPAQAGELLQNLLGH